MREKGVKGCVATEASGAAKVCREESRDSLSRLTVRGSLSSVLSDSEVEEVMATQSGEGFRRLRQDPNELVHCGPRPHHRSCASGRANYGGLCGESFGRPFRGRRQGVAVSISKRCPACQFCHSGASPLRALEAAPIGSSALPRTRATNLFPTHHIRLQRQVTLLTIHLSIGSHNCLTNSLIHHHISVLIALLPTFLPSSFLLFYLLFPSFPHRCTRPTAPPPPLPRGALR